MHHTQSIVVSESRDDLVWLFDPTAYQHKGQHRLSQEVNFVVPAC